MADAGTLLIDRGDLPSLVAVTVEARPQHLVLYHPAGSDAAGAPRQGAVEEHGALFGVRRVLIEPQAPGTGGRDEGLDQALALLQAAVAARRQGCTRIVWAQQVGPDPDAVGAAVERASLVSALAENPGGQPPGPELVIDLPLVDLTDAQLADLAEDGGAPMHAFWPCRGGGEVPCGVCGGCRRWQAGFAEAGVAWPWAPVAAS